MSQRGKYPRLLAELIEDRPTAIAGLYRGGDLDPAAIVVGACERGMVHLVKLRSDWKSLSGPSDVAWLFITEFHDRSAARNGRPSA